MGILLSLTVKREAISARGSWVYLGKSLERSLVGLMARAFLLIPIGTEGEKGIVASVATEEATSWMNRGGDGKGSLLARFEAEVAAFGSSEDLFLVELPPWVVTIVCRSRHNTMKPKREKRRKEKVVLGQI